MSRPKRWVDCGPNGIACEPCSVLKRVDGWMVVECLGVPLRFRFHAKTPENVKLRPMDHRRGFPTAKYWRSAAAAKRYVDKEYPLK